ncbi:MAG: hypothetical protein NXI08_01955 [bacterium]|nr:hypothetical protein [bacterium]
MNYQELLSLPTNQLLSIFQQRNASQETEEIVFTIICDRFKINLMRAIQTKCNHYRLGVSIAEEILEITFKKFAQTRSFNFSKSKAKTVDDAFSIYLFFIANNSIKDRKEEEIKKVQGKYYDGTEFIITDLPKIDPNKLDLRSKVIYETVRSLTLQERTVYLTYKEYEKDGVRLPRLLLKQLRKQLGDVKQTTIRSHKKNAIDTINNALKVMNLTIEELK